MFNPSSNRSDNLNAQPPLAGNGNSGPGWTPYTGAIHNRSAVNDPDFANRVDNPTVINPAGPSVGAMTGVSAPASIAAYGGALGVAPVENTGFMSTPPSYPPPMASSYTTSSTSTRSTGTTMSGTHIGKDLGTTTGLGSYATDFTDRTSEPTSMDRSLNTMNPNAAPATLASVGYAKPLGTTAYDSNAMPTGYGTGNVGTINTMGLASDAPLGATSTGYTTTDAGLGAAGLGATAGGAGLAGYEAEKHLGGSTSSDPTEHVPSKMTAYADKAMGSLKKGVGAVFSENLREKGVMQKAQGQAELEANRAAHDFKAAEKEGKGISEEFSGAPTSGAANRADADVQSAMGSSKNY